MTRTKLSYPQMQLEWWEEIGRTTLGVAGNTITVSSLPAKKYLCILVAVSATGGTESSDIRFNGDTAANYSFRISTNGAADTTSTAQTSLSFSGATASLGEYLTLYVKNLAALAKQVIGNSITDGSAAAAPARRELAGAWGNTAVQISSVSVTNLFGTGNFAIGSEVIILGHD